MAHTKGFHDTVMLGVVYMKRRLRTVFKFPVGNRVRKSHSSQFLEQMHSYPICGYVLSVERKRRKGRGEEEITLILDEV